MALLCFPKAKREGGTGMDCLRGHPARRTRILMHHSAAASDSNCAAYSTPVGIPTASYCNNSLIKVPAKRKGLWTAKKSTAALEPPATPVWLCREHSTPGTSSSTTAGQGDRGTAMTCWCSLGPGSTGQIFHPLPSCNGCQNNPDI